MIKRIIVAALFAVALNAQIPEVFAPSATGVSDTLLNYSKQTQSSLVLAAGDEATIAKPLSVARPKGARHFAPLVAAAASSMFNQTSNATLPVTISKNYTGLGTGFNGTWTVQGVLPPDPVIGVGLTQIVQWVNLRLTVLDKATGSPLLAGAGYVNGNQIWSGLGVSSVCANQNQGDPNVQYDRLAGRWVLSQLAFTLGTATTTFNVYPAAPYAICMAVSQTSDATGAYNLYQFLLGNFPDLAKLAVCPDAYYMTDNAFAYNTTTGSPSYSGGRVCAFDRAAMIAGNPAASSVCFSGLDAGGGTHFDMLAGDFEGSMSPPANETEFILNGDWFSKLTGPYALQLRRFHPDFVTPANSTLTDGLGGGFDSFVSLPFDSSVKGACGDVGGACVPQPGTTRVLATDSLNAMHRLAYRNLGANRETLVFTETVDPVGTAVAGIQLVEIRNPTANPPAIYNNVNFNPDATNRWMGSAASDKLGNVALGYSVASGTVAPGIRITGRLRNDIKNSVRGEMTVQDGSGSQTSSAQRWGDYSTMQIDPSDDCTFWYTAEYIINTSGADWATRIAAFKFNNCQ